MAKLTDREIVEGLLARDNKITRQFFFEDCRPLMLSIMRLVFNYPVEYDELINELYQYIMADDGAKLRQFKYRSTFCQWLKVVAIRFFIHHKDNAIDDSSKEAPYDSSCNATVDSAAIISDRIDVECMLGMMENKRYADAIRNIVLGDVEPEQYAARIGVTVDNLYNIKKRAMAAFTAVAIKYYGYGK